MIQCIHTVHGKVEIIPWLMPLTDEEQALGLVVVIELHFSATCQQPLTPVTTCILLLELTLAAFITRCDQYCLKMGFVTDIVNLARLFFSRS
jgi:hypothetical protein